MINSKVTKQAEKQSSEEKLFKLLESIDWKLWEMYKILKDAVPAKPGAEETKTAEKTKNEQ